MNRRHFLLSLSATALSSTAMAYPSVAYEPASWPDLRDSSGKIILNWRASWSITCQIKKEIITDLLEQDPSYGTLTFVDVDWDTFGPSVWAERLRIKRRSTLVALNGKTEIARLVNQPYERNLRRFLDSALAA